MRKRLALIIFPVCFFIGFLGANLPDFSVSPHAKPEPILKSLAESSADYSKGALIDIGLCKNYFDYVHDIKYPPFYPEVSKLNPLIAVYYIEARPPPAIS